MILFNVWKGHFLGETNGGHLVLVNFRVLFVRFLAKNTDWRSDRRTRVWYGR